MTKQKEIWIGMVEVRPFKDSKLLEFATGAFVNVLTWASTEDEFQAKARTLVDHLHLDLVGIDDSGPLSNRGPRENLEQETAEIVEEMQFTPEAIRYCTFHTWNEQLQ